jgi:dipeptidase D
MLRGDIMLNLDTEEDNEIGVGCAGGIDVTFTLPYEEERVPEEFTAYRIEIKGLNGGHSGMQIHEGLGNANKISNRLLYSVINVIQISEIDGGGLRNAIPRESIAIIVSNCADDRFIKTHILEEIKNIKSEFKTTEPNLDITIDSVDRPDTMLGKNLSINLIKAIYATHNGVFRMSPDIPGLVETSNNVARVSVKDKVVKILCLTRSSVESSKMDLANKLRATFELIGGDVEFSGNYPGWTPNMESSILKVMRSLYIELHNEEPHVAACHAGLECGILGTNYPNMEMISFGPNIKGAHSPDERAQISSVQKYWKFVLEILKKIPKS